jgi:hypothetical protein
VALAFPRSWLAVEDFRGFDATSAVSGSWSASVAEWVLPELDTTTPGAASVVDVEPDPVDAEFPSVLDEPPWPPPEGV